MFDLFETFLTLYETKSFTATSNHLFITQSTVTKRLQKLESNLETTLFDRQNNKNITPTFEANKFYPIALNFVETWKKTKKDFINHSAKTTVIVGVSQSGAKFILPKLFFLLTEYLQYINLKVQIYDSKKIFSLIKSHEIHIGIIDQNLSDPKVDKIPLFKDMLVLAGNISTSLFFLREIKLQHGYFMKKFLNETKLNFQHIVTLNDTETIINHINHGFGASLIPKKLLPKNIHYKNLGSEYNLNYSIVYYPLESNSEVNKILDKIRKNVNLLTS